MAEAVYRPAAAVYRSAAEKVVDESTAVYQVYRKSLRLLNVRAARLSVYRRWSPARAPDRLRHVRRWAARVHTARARRAKRVTADG